MELLIKGFKKQDKITLQQVIDSIMEIPQRHRKLLRAIVYDPKRLFQRSYVVPKSINFNALGEYDRCPLEHILIYDFKDLNQFRHVLYHEMGHHVYWRILDSKMRKTWVTQVSREEPKVSEYAKRNASENFAESYAFYIQNPSILLNMPIKRDFIKAIF